MKTAAPFIPTLALVLSLACTPALAAGNFVVSDCGDNGGPDQLRAKITEANVALGGNISFTCTGTITLNSALPNILAEMTIDGSSAITLSGGDSVPILNNFSTLHLEDIRLVDGRASGSGGALYTSNGTLTLANVKIDSSRAQNDGGALYANNSTVTIENSELTNNEAVGDAGGLYNFKGTLTLTNVKIDGNKSGAFAGALYNDAGQVTWTGGSATGNDATDAGAIVSLDRGLLPAAKTSLDSVLVSGNEAVNRAGAFYVFLGATLEVADGSIANNAAGGDGGAIYSEGEVKLRRVLLRANDSAGSGGALAIVSGTAGVSSSTLYDNEATIGATVANGDGNVSFDFATIVGGDDSATASLFQYNSGSITLAQSILEKRGLPANCFVIDEDPGTIETGGFNLSDDDSCAAWLDAETDEASADAELGPLTDNGGDTDTLVPLAGSIAVDVVHGEACVGVDQRGVTRPQGEACDVGAVEVAACAESVPKVCGDATGDGNVTAPDALAALRVSVGSSTCALWLCDFNGAGGITAADALAILRTAVGQPTNANCPAPYDCYAYL